jgi:dTDP-4-dehydrorhamnose reductase
VRVFEEMPQNPDYVINCIGTIKPQMHKNMADSIFINALLPHQLSGTCSRLGVKFITITSDCVYSGFKGKYSETDLHDALDAYGKSKSLGEPEDCMVIRTSIIGEEIHNNTSLIAWAKSQAGKKVSGFRDHLWNGVVTKQYASVCDQIISQGLYEMGTFHVHSDSVTKYELLKLINARFDLGLQIAEVDSTNPINRTIATTKPLLAKLNIPTIKDQIMNL